MTEKLARVRWKMGQTLLPEHFVAQEEAFLAEVGLRFRLQGLPAHGIASLKWNPTLLSEGVLSLSAASVVMPSGLLLDVPGNALATPLNLNVPGTATVSAYLHLLEKPASEETVEESWSPDSGGIPRTVYQIMLSAEQGQSEAIESMKLAELRRDPEGIWQLSDRYVPPLLLLGTTPFMQAELDELGPVLEAFQYKLAMDSASYLSGSGLYAVKQCLRGVYRMQRLLANLKAQVHLHPYVAYELLKDFYLEVCFYRDSAPKDITEPYNHEQLAACFRKILAPLRDQLHLAEKRSPYLPFALRDGVYRIDLPKEMRQAKEIYFLIQKNQMQRVVSLRDFKIGSPSRLSMIHKLALEGIPVRKVDRPVLAHSFGPEVEFYQLAQGDEWDHALREEAVAFYGRAEFAELEFYLYWYTG